jgi:hypothetical protein
MASLRANIHGVQVDLVFNRLLGKPWAVIDNGPDVHVLPLQRGHEISELCPCFPKVAIEPDSRPIIIHEMMHLA